MWIDAGESLLEVTAAVAVLAVVLLPAARLTLYAAAWLNDVASQEQALAYAERGVQYVRQMELQSYQQALAQKSTWTPQPVSPQPLAPVRGVSFTESIAGPVPVSWGSGKFTLYQWTVTVSWTNPVNRAERSLSLTAVVNPVINNGS
ncbi:MAG: hypothetical protein IRZ33_04535 [Alicyclobacillaceae bacterium]|nr:hypothetical protein [Alicyclobacillaceae bacterium]